MTSSPTIRFATEAGKPCPLTHHSPRSLLTITLPNKRRPWNPLAHPRTGRVRKRIVLRSRHRIFSFSNSLLRPSSLILLLLLLISSYTGLRPHFTNLPPSPPFFLYRTYPRRRHGLILHILFHMARLSRNISRRFIYTARIPGLGLWETIDKETSEGGGRD